MGTRNLTIVVSDKQNKIAQYGQWDGYPEGQGVTVLGFCRKHLATEQGRTRFRKQLDRVRFINETRDTAAEILDIVNEATSETIAKDSSAFAADSLFCEWCYVVDLDEKTFEVYEGFNQTPLAEGERFAHLPVKDEERRKKNDSVYYPVKLVRCYALDDLPSKEAFLAFFAKRAEEKEAAYEAEAAAQAKPNALAAEIAFQERDQNQERDQDKN